MSRSSDFWESIDTRWCRLLTVSTGRFTTYNTGVMGSVVYMITAFSRRIQVLFFKTKNPCTSRTPILEGKFLPKKVRLIHAKIRYFMRAWKYISSSRALQSVVGFGFQYSFPPFLTVNCIVFSTNLFLRDWDNGEFICWLKYEYKHEIFHQVSIRIFFVWLIVIDTLSAANLCTRWLLRL
jgi:hypothetical protein